MPNWVTNTVTVTGEPVEIDKFKQTLARPYPQQKTAPSENDKYRNTVEGEWEIPDEPQEEFAFWNIIAPPEEHWEQYFGVHGWSDGEERGKNPWNWYEWNCRVWGTKWSASDCCVVDEAAGSVTYHFNTPWDTPRGIWQALADQYPQLNIFVRYQEEQGWGGELVIENEDIMQISEWDIPTSHSDWQAIDEDCPACEYEWDPYDDCPDLEGGDQ